MTSYDAASDQDDLAIRRLEGEYDAAWNRGDVSRLAALYVPDAVVINPRGEITRGRTAIQASLQAFVHGRAKGSRHSTTISAIANIARTVAIVDGEAQLENLGDTFSESVLRHAFTDIVVKKQSGWSLAHTRAYMFATL